MSGPADLQALTTAMTTTGMIDPAAKSALGLDPREWPKVVWIEVTSAGSQAVKLLVRVDPGPNALKQTGPAALLLNELVNRAKTVVNQSWEPRRQELRARLDELEKRRAELRANLERLRRRARDAEASEARGRIGLTQSVSGERRRLEAELAAKRPRLRALREVQAKMESRPDEVGKALRDLVSAREALASGLEKGVAEGKRDPVELLRARADLAEARVRVAEWGRKEGSSPGRGLWDDVLSLEVDVTALEAQLRALPAVPDETAREPGEDAQQLRMDVSRAEVELNTLEHQYQQARNEYEPLATPPSLVVLDGRPQ
jgi:DNA repair exonuclease SbcCD ATPase subunit